MLSTNLVPTTLQYPFTVVTKNIKLKHDLAYLVATLDCDITSLGFHNWLNVSLNLYKQKFDHLQWVTLPLSWLNLHPQKRLFLGPVILWLWFPKKLPQIVKKNKSSTRLNKDLLYSGSSKTLKCYWFHTLFCVTGFTHSKQYLLSDINDQILS